MPGGAATVIIAVSAHSFKEEQQEMLDAGCAEFLAKHFEEHELLTVLATHLHLVLADIGEEYPTFAVRPQSSADLRTLY